MVSLLRVHPVKGHRLSLCPQSVRGGSGIQCGLQDHELKSPCGFKLLTNPLPRAALTCSSYPPWNANDNQEAKIKSVKERGETWTLKPAKNCPKAIASKWKCYRNILHIEWLYRAGDGELTGMRKVTECVHDDVTPRQSETIHGSSKSTHTCREGKKRQMSEC